MTDSQTKKEIRVTGNAEGGYYIRTLFSELPRVRQELDRHEIPYWVDSRWVSLNGEPPVIVVNLRRAADPKKTQAVLDSAS